MTKQDNKDALPVYNKDLVRFYDATLSNDQLLDPERYTDIEALSSGAIKHIFRACDTHCGRDIALARIKHEVSSSVNALDFVREVQLTASLEHPNIIRIYDIGISDGEPWFTMELTSGKTLKDKLEESSQLGLFDKLDIFIQLCDAIAYAHNKDVLHLDLKPDNISLGKHGRVLLCDWGIASSISSLPEDDLIKTQTLHGYIKGSPGFMAPEQTQPGYTKHTSADIFGLGAVLYYMLTGQAPVGGDTPAEIITRTRANQLSSLDHPSIPVRLRPLLRKALAFKPDERYQSAAELQQEIEQYLNGFATYAEEASLYTQIRLFYQRNKAICTIVLLSLLSLFVLSAYYIQALKQSEQTAISAQQTAEKSFRQYKEEQLAREQTNEAFSNMLVLHNQANLQDLKLDEAIDNAERAARLNPDNPDVQMQLGFTYFASFQFEQAARCLERSAHENTEDLLPIARAYSRRNLAFSSKQTIQLYRQIPTSRKNLRIYMLYFHSQMHPPEEHCLLVAHMLAQRNQLPDIQLHYDPISQTLDLSNNPGLLHLESPRNALMPAVNLLSSLPIRSLILDNSEAHRANQQTIASELNCTITLRDPRPTQQPVPGTGQAPSPPKP